MNGITTNVLPSSNFQHVENLPTDATDVFDRLRPLTDSSATTDGNRRWLTDNSKLQSVAHHRLPYPPPHPSQWEWAFSSLNNQNLIQYEKWVCTLGYGKKKSTRESLKCHYVALLPHKTDQLQTLSYWHCQYFIDLLIRSRSFYIHSLHFCDNVFVQLIPFLFVKSSLMSTFFYNQSLHHFFYTGPGPSPTRWRRWWDSWRYETFEFVGYIWRWRGQWGR